MKYIVYGVSELREVGKNGNKVIEFHTVAPLGVLDKRNGFKGIKFKVWQIWNPGMPGGCDVDGDLLKLPVLPFEIDVESRSYNNKEFVDLIQVGKHVDQQLIV